MSEKQLLVAILVVLICFSVFVFKIVFSDKKYEMLHDRLLRRQDVKGDVEVYLYLAKKFSRFDFLDDSDWCNRSYSFNIHYKFPPLYPLFLAPMYWFKVDMVSYVFVFNEFLSALAFIPLYFFARRHIPRLLSFIVPVIPLFSYPYTWTYPWIVGIGLPMPLYLFFLFCFMCTMYDEKYLLSSVFFGLLLLTHYITLYLFPFVLIWLFFCHRKSFRLFFKTLLLFLLIPLCFVSLWFVRNGLIHGFSMRGVFGGYSSFFHRFYIYPNLFLSKVFSLSQVFAFPNRIQFTMFVFLAFVFSFLPFSKYEDKRFRMFAFCLRCEAVFLFFSTAFMYNTEYINFKYLFTFSALFLFVFLVEMSIMFINVKHEFLEFLKVRQRKSDKGLYRCVNPECFYFSHPFKHGFVSHHGRRCPRCGGRLEKVDVFQK